MSWLAGSTLFARLSRKAAHITGQPAAFVTAVAGCILWAVVGPLFGFSNGWQLVINTGTTVLTFLMIFLVQASQNQNDQAIHAKLDGLIGALDLAPNDLNRAEDRSPAEIEELRPDKGGR